MKQLLCQGLGALPRLPKNLSGTVTYGVSARGVRRDDMSSACRQVRTVIMTDHLKRLIRKGFVTVAVSRQGDGPVSQHDKNCGVCALSTVSEI
jgi:hypothetical protein